VKFYAAGELPSPPKANKMEIMDRVTENYRKDESAF